MLVSCSWLKEYINLNMSPVELANKLAMAGIPVEEIIERNSGVSGVVAAKILSIEKHPNADNLSLCDVTDGKEQLKIVCGAKNIAPGQIVPLAKDGASLPGGVKIRKTNIRGIESSGMLCSSKELGLDDDHSGILILNADEYSPGKAYIPYEPDTVLNLEITPNRADLLCITGLARFISSICGLKLSYTSCDIAKDRIDTTLDIHAKLKVDTKDTERCPRYTARLIEGVTIAASPAWLKNRLSASGIRPINNVVDVTNYVMLELNQPLHAFDHSKIKSGNIIVRAAGKNEKIIALDGKTYELKDTDLVIADTKEAIAIAGVMGGEHFSIDNSTRDVILESAFFSPKSVRKTSRSLSLSSDSSYRFERGIDIENVDRALSRATDLLIQVAGGMASRNFIDVYPQKYRSKLITVRFDRINKLLGTAFTEKEASDIIKKLDFPVSGKKSGSITVEIPSYRVDIGQEADIIEDIAQIYGYDNIPLTLPCSVATLGGEPSLDGFIREIHKLMSGFGFFEVKNYSFFNNKNLKDFHESSAIPADAIRLLNPFNEEETSMKTTLIPDLIKNLITNYNNENEDMHLFETAYAYFKTDAGYIQSPRLAAVSCGNLIRPAYNHKEFKSDFIYMKSVITGVLGLIHAGKKAVFEPSAPAPFFEFSADINVDGANVGRAGQLKEDILYDNKFKDKAYMFELDLSALLSMMETRLRYVRISRFPVVKRDLSIIVPAGIEEARVESLIMSGHAGLIRSLDLYDLYRGGQVPQGSKSLTYSIVFQSAEKTLSDDEINVLMAEVVNKLKAEINAGLRS
jgi:phenylalanyl-tRNA synthetase beta chain